jgi:hypothetical protein
MYLEQMTTDNFLKRNTVANFIGRVLIGLMRFLFGSPVSQISGGGIVWVGGVLGHTGQRICSA